MSETEIASEIKYLLRPISSDCPAGPDLSHSGVFSEIDDALGRFGENAGEACVVSENFLSNKSKDLRCAVRYANALTRRDGCAGLSDALSLIVGLIETFGDTLHPSGSRTTWSEILQDNDQALSEAVVDIPPIPTGNGVLPRDGSPKFDADLRNAPIEYFENASSRLQHSLKTLRRLHFLLADRVSGPIQRMPALTLEIENKSKYFQELIKRKDALQASSNTAVSDHQPNEDANPVQRDATSGTKEESNTSECAPREDGGQEPVSDLGGDLDIDDLSINTLARARSLAGLGKYPDAQKLVHVLILQARGGRSKFLLRLLLAEICLEAGNSAVACELLRAMANEIEAQNLPEWETPHFLLPPLLLLHNYTLSSEERQRAFELICRIDPLAAIQLLEKRIET